MFDQTYYDTIWPTQGVHRHDYCPGLAQCLISKYGKVCFLDIGTSCGYLVQCLRELGAEAWGIDVSDYAISEAHSHFIIKGDIRNIPFAADSFDVVHSQGVWGYFPKEDISKAWSECQRVGKIQIHNIDYNDTDPDHKYLFAESEQWWKNQFYPKVLIACPNHECKEYAFAPWIAAAYALGYPNKEILVVDNSPTLDFYNRWQDKVSMTHLTLSEGPNRRIALSMEYIRQYFLAGDYTWWFNLESDVIVPPSMLSLLLTYPSDWTSHYYPQRGGVEPTNGFGCSLFSRQIAEVSFCQAPETATTDSWWWNQQIKPRTPQFKIIELYDFLAVRHI